MPWWYTEAFARQSRGAVADTEKDRQYMVVIETRETQQTLSAHWRESEIDNSLEFDATLSEIRLLHLFIHEYNAD